MLPGSGAVSPASSGVTPLRGGGVAARGGQQLTALRGAHHAPATGLASPQSAQQPLFANNDCFITVSTQHVSILHYTVSNGEGNVNKIIECLQNWVLDFNRTVVNSFVNIANDYISLHLIQIKGLLLLSM